MIIFWLISLLATERLTLLDLLLIESKGSGLPLTEEQKKIMVAILNKEKNLLAILNKIKNYLKKKSVTLSQQKWPKLFIIKTVNELEKRVDINKIISDIEIEEKRLYQQAEQEKAMVEVLPVRFEKNMDAFKIYS